MNEERKDIFGKPLLDKTPWWRILWKKGSKAPVSRSKYKPHQGERERARRLDQLARGTINR